MVDMQVSVVTMWVMLMDARVIAFCICLLTGGQCVAVPFVVTQHVDQIPTPLPGSFRDGLMKLWTIDPQTGNQFTSISFAPNIPDTLAVFPIFYQKPGKLVIDGNGATVTASPTIPSARLFQATQTSDVDISDMTFDGAGAFAVPINSGDTMVMISFANSMAEKNLKLDDVTIRSSGANGINCQYKGSLVAEITNCSFDNNADRGMLIIGSESDTIETDVTINDTSAVFNGCDGIQVRDNGNGDVFVSVNSSVFSGGTSACGEAGNGGDGLDIEERRFGDVGVSILNSTVIHCGAEGFDLAEGHVGDLLATVTGSNSFHAGKDGFSAVEESSGFVDYGQHGGQSFSADDEGIQIKESGHIFDHRDVDVELTNVLSSDSEKSCLKIEEGTFGDMNVSVSNSNFRKSRKKHGIILEENNSGKIEFFMFGGGTFDNDNDGVRCKAGGFPADYPHPTLEDWSEYTFSGCSLVGDDDNSFQQMAGVGGILQEDSSFWALNANFSKTIRIKASMREDEDGDPITDNMFWSWDTTHVGHDLDPEESFDIIDNS